MKSANAIMQNAMRDIADVAKHLILTDGCDSRGWDDCFENGNSSTVVEWLKRDMETDPSLRIGVIRNSYWMPHLLILHAEVLNGKTA